MNAHRRGLARASTAFRSVVIGRHGSSCADAEHPSDDVAADIEKAKCWRVDGFIHEERKKHRKLPMFVKTLAGRPTSEPITYDLMQLHIRHLGQKCGYITSKKAYFSLYGLRRGWAVNAINGNSLGVSHKIYQDIQMENHQPARFGKYWEHDAIRAGRPANLLSSGVDLERGRIFLSLGGIAPALDRDGFFDLKRFKANRKPLPTHKEFFRRFGIPNHVLLTGRKMLTCPYDGCKASYSYIASFVGHVTTCVKSAVGVITCPCGAYRTVSKVVVAGKVPKAEVDRQRKRYLSIGDKHHMP